MDIKKIKLLLFRRDLKDKRGLVTTAAFFEQTSPDSPLSQIGLLYCPEQEKGSSLSAHQAPSQIQTCWETPLTAGQIFCWGKQNYEHSQHKHLNLMYMQDLMSVSDIKYQNPHTLAKNWIPAVKGLVLLLFRSPSQTEPLLCLPTETERWS